MGANKNSSCYKQQLPDSCIEFGIRPNSNQSDDWFVLGPFDYCKITPILRESVSSQEPWLSVLAQYKKERSGEDGFDMRNKQFFIVNQSQKDDDAGFKSEPKLFQLISFVHLTQSSQTNAFATTVQNMAGSHEDVEYQVFRALNYCDEIVVFRAVKYEILLQIADKLNQDSAVSYIYSTLCMAANIEVKDIADDASMAQGYVRAQLNSTQQRVELVEIMEEAFEQKMAAHIIPGHEDVYCPFQEVSYKKLLQFEKAVAKNGFHDVVTTLTCSEFDKGHIKQGTQSQVKSERWIVQVKDIQRLGCKPEMDAVEGAMYGWGAHLIEELKQLAYMEKQGSAKEIFALIAPAMDAFIELLGSENFENYIKNVPEDEGRHMMDRFARGVLVLLQHASNMDLQMMQLPNRAPSLAEYSTKLVAAYGAFGYQVTELLRSLDQTPTADYTLLMVPKLCLRIRNNTIFPVSEQTETASFSQRIIDLDLPFGCLDDPQLTLISLIHEVAHVVGHDLRSRKEREDAFLQCMILELLLNLGIVTSPMAWLKLKTTIVNDHYRRKGKENHEPHRLTEQGAGICKTLMNLCDCSSETLVDLFCEFDSAYVAKYTRYQNLPFGEEKYQLSLDLSDQCTEFWSRVKRYVWPVGVNSELPKQTLASTRNFLQELFKECYADIVMITLLDLDLESYVESFYRTEEKAFNHPENIFDYVEKTRIQCVMRCMNMKEKKQCHWKFPDVEPRGGVLKDGKNKAKTYIDAYNRDTDTAGTKRVSSFVEQLFYSFYQSEENKISEKTIYIVADYLAVCQMKLEKALEKVDSDAIQNIRESYQALKSTDGAKVIEVMSALLEAEKVRQAPKNTKVEKCGNSAEVAPAVDSVTN